MSQWNLISTKKELILELISDLTTAPGKFNQHRAQIIMLRTSLTFAVHQVGFESREKAWAVIFDLEQGAYQLLPL